VLSPPSSPSIPSLLRYVCSSLCRSCKIRELNSSTYRLNGLRIARRIHSSGCFKISGGKSKSMTSLCPRLCVVDDQDLPSHG
jgi:hypothetical protein